MGVGWGEHMCCACVHAHVEARVGHQVSWPITHYLTPLRQCLSLNLAWAGSQQGQQSSWTSTGTVPGMNAAAPTFWHGCWDPNSGPHVCMPSPLAHWAILSHEGFIFLNYLMVLVLFFESLPTPVWRPSLHSHRLFEWLHVKCLQHIH